MVGKFLKNRLPKVEISFIGQCQGCHYYINKN